MLGVSPRSVATAKKVQQAAPELAEKVKAGEVSLNAAAPYLRLMLGVAISRGSGLTPCASRYPRVVSVRLVLAGLCRVTFMRLSFGGGGTSRSTSALNTFPQDRHRLNPGLSLTAALCHDPQKHLRCGAMRKPSAVTDSEVFSMGLPFVKCALHNGGAVIMALCVP